MLVLAAGVAAAIVFALGPRPRRGLASGIALLFAVLFTAGVAVQIQLGARLQSDGFYYFAYLRSMAFDRDVELSNDYRLLGLGDKAHLFQLTPTKHAQSAWTVGPAILWAPFFAAGHLVARDLGQRDPNVTATGISFPYRQAVCIAGLFYGLLGCWFAFRFAGCLIDRRVAAAATATTIAGSFMLWYLLKEPSMTHAPSMALVAGFAWAWLATRERRSTAQWAMLGLVAGLMTLVRWQNAIFAVLPACDAVMAAAGSWRRADRPGLRDVIVKGAIFTTVAALAFLPQMLAWKAIYGSWLAVSPVGPQIRFGDPHVVDILWSARNGLFSTSPVLAVAAAGLLLFTTARPAVGLPMLLAVGAMTYFNACIQDWWGSDGYGGRRFDGTLPFLGVGLGYLAIVAHDIVRRVPGVALAAAAAMLVMWNVTQLAVAQAGIVRIGEATSFGHTMAAQAAQFHRWFGNPFTYPVSLVYALRNGVSPGRYDLLAANEFLGDPLRPYGRLDLGSADDWFIEAGWHQPEREGAVTFRWAAVEAGLLLPLDHPALLRLQVRLHAFAFPGAPEQSLIVAVNGREHGPVRVESGWHTAELEVPRDSWRAGANRIQLRFAWAKSPADAGLGGDSRVLAAALDYVRVAVP